MKEPDCHAQLLGGTSGTPRVAGQKGGGRISRRLQPHLGAHQSHAFIHSRVHSFIQQLILTEQAHSPALDWALATVARPLMASAPRVGRPGGCHPLWAASRLYQRRTVSVL